MSDAPRAQWNSKIGFVLAAMGSAVGFGSISRFPMNTANNGGAVFVLIYIGCMFLVGIPLMISEFSVGRPAQSNPVGAFKRLNENVKTRWRGAGFFYLFVTIFFISWYAVIAGWVLRYVFASATGEYFSDPGGFLVSVAEGPVALLGLFAVMGLTLVIVLGAVSKGIERLNLVMMPLLFLIVVFIALYALTLPNIADGYSFYLSPDFSQVNLGVVTSAVGQAFFSLSLGMGVMLTYASYLPKQQSLAGGAFMISFSTLVFAIMCGFMIFPLMSSFGMLDSEAAAGLGLIFGPLSETFAAMGAPWGNIVGTLFFSATFFAAFTSCVSLVEPAISYVQDEHKVGRKRAAVLVCAITYTAGIISAFSMNRVDFFGGPLVDAMILLGGFLICLYVGWFSPRAKAMANMDECEKGMRLARFVHPIVRFGLPPLLAALLFFSIVGTPCALSGGAEAGSLVQSFGGPALLACSGAATASGLSDMSALAALGLTALIGAVTLALLFLWQGMRNRGRDSVLPPVDA